MYDPAPQRGPLTRQERQFYAVFLLALMGLFAAEVFTNYQPAKLSALLFIVFWFPLLALHEFGHAIVAVALHWRVEHIVIGVGRVVSRFQIGKAQVELRLLPIEGFVRSVPKDLRFPGLKHALIYFAGPGIEILLAGMIVWLVGAQRMFTKTDDYTIIFWQSLAAASTMGAVLNLVPHSAQTVNGIVPNDGLGIILSLFRRANAYRLLLPHQLLATADHDKSSKQAT